MSKVMVEVRVPAAGVRSDLLLPFECPLYETIELLKAVLADETQGGFTASEDSVLCEAMSGTALNVNLSAEEAGLLNGSRLILL